GHGALQSTEPAQQRVRVHVRVSPSRGSCPACGPVFHVSPGGVMNVDYVRALRTTGSERFVVRKATVDSALLEIHYLLNGTVQATLIVFEGAGITESDIPAVLTHIDEVLLPDVSFDDHKLLFTVVVGRVHG